MKWNAHSGCAVETEENIPDIDIPYRDFLRQLNHKFLKLDQSRVHHASGRLSVSRNVIIEYVFL
jgi:hypothetical protein